jgi:hypothetical protein
VVPFRDRDSSGAMVVLSPLSHTRPSSSCDAICAPLFRFILASLITFLAIVRSVLPRSGGSSYGYALSLSPPGRSRRQALRSLRNSH